MKHAIIQTGGKQYLVSEGSLVKVEKLSEEEGKKMSFDEVLLVSDGKSTELGSPTIKDAKVLGKVVRNARHKKIWGVKMKSKKRNRKLFGHKQHFTEVEISKI